MQEFDDGFRRLCLQHDVVASYVRLARNDPSRLLSGGHAELDRFVSSKIRG